MIIGITVENIYSASFFLYNFFSIKNKLSSSFISLLTSSGIWLVLIFPFFFFLSPFSLFSNVIYANLSTRFDSCHALIFPHFIRFLTHISSFLILCLPSFSLLSFTSTSFLRDLTHFLSLFFLTSSGTWLMSPSHFFSLFLFSFLFLDRLSR